MLFLTFVIFLKSDNECKTKTVINDIQSFRRRSVSMKSFLPESFSVVTKTSASNKSLDTGQWPGPYHMSGETPRAPGTLETWRVRGCQPAPDVAITAALRLRPAAMTRGRSCWRPATTGKGLENKSVCLSVIPEHLTRF